MESLFDRIKNRMNLVTNHVHYTTNLMGENFESHSNGISNQNHEAFKALCEEVDDDISEIKKLVVIMDTVMQEQREIFLKLQENLLEKGFLTKDEMIIK